jgi:hypothetical protein
MCCVLGSTNWEGTHRVISIVLDLSGRTKRARLILVESRSQMSPCLMMRWLAAKPSSSSPTRELVGRKQRIELGASYHALANGGFSRRGVSDSSCRCVQRGKLDSKRFRVNYLPVRVKFSPMSRNAATSLPGYTARERSKLLCSSMI